MIGTMIEAVDRPLVPGCECGERTVYCRELNIDAPELKKLAGTLCSRCRGLHHETRESVCRAITAYGGKAPLST